MNIGIYIYDGAEVLDFSGPFEVFSTAARMSKSKDIFNVFLVSEHGNPINARGGFSVNPTFSFHQHPQIDVLVIVGGVHYGELRRVLKIDFFYFLKKTRVLFLSF